MEALHHTYTVAQLKGAELLAALEKLGPASKAEMARTCGYFSINEKGVERVNANAFVEAFMEAKGVSLGAVRTGNSAGRGLGYITRRQAKGALVIGTGYVEQLGFEPGQPFKIEVDPEAGTVLLTAVDEAEVEAEDDDEE